MSLSLPCHALCLIVLCLSFYSYNSPNKDTIPPGALRYLLSNENATSEIDDDGFEVGVNGTVGGFSSIYITKNNMTVRFHDQNGTVLYTSWVPPRHLHHSDGDSDKLDPAYVIIIGISCAAGAVVLGLIVYYACLKRRIITRGTSMAPDPEGVEELKQEASSHAGKPLLDPSTVTI